MEDCFSFFPTIQYADKTCVFQLLPSDIKMDVGDHPHEPDMSSGGVSNVDKRVGPHTGFGDDDLIMTGGYSEMKGDGGNHETLSPMFPSLACYCCNAQISNEGFKDHLSE